MPIGRLHVLTDFHFQQHLSHAELARRALRGGADTIQFRHKAAGIRHQLHQAELTARACRDAGEPLIVNDRIDVMLAVEADGVHLGQTDFPIDAARRLLGPEALIGATATTTKQAVRAQKEGADYIGFGPVFPTHSKKNPASVKGLRGLEETCRAVDIPIIAIAGMTPERASQALQAGAHGVAVMTAITMADDPEEATRQFRRALE